MSIKRKSEGPQAAPGGKDRRDEGRVARPRQVAVYPWHAQGLGRPMRASLTDASPTSIGLVCLGSLPVGARFVLRLERPSGPPSLQVYHVIRSRDAGGWACLVGAEFEEDFAIACPLPGVGAAAAANANADAAPAMATSPAAA
jgi:hypothetical protein